MGLVAKINILPLIIFILAGQVYADKNDLFLEGLDNIVKLDFLDGSVYQGQVNECLIELTKTTCMSGIGIYDFKAGSKYFGNFKANKPQPIVSIKQFLAVDKANSERWGYSW